MSKNLYEDTIVPLLAGSMDNIILFFKEERILKSEIICEECGNALRWIKKSQIDDGYVWKCFEKLCIKFKIPISIRYGSFLSTSKINLGKWLDVLYRWSKNEQIVNVMKDLNISKPTLVKIFKKMRYQCCKYMSENVPKLGGRNVICQVDESLFSHKQKYHRGRSSEEIWVFGIVDTSFKPAKGYVEIVSKRSASTLLPIIRKICLPGTIVHSDQWAAYRRISEMGYSHETVNHKLHFVDPLTGTHTQHVESFWNKLKSRCKKMKGIRKIELNSYLQEDLWRENNGEHFFKRTLDLIRL